MEQASDVMQRRLSPPKDGSQPDGAVSLDIAKMYSLAYNESYRHYVRRKMMIALAATSLLLIISILMMIAAGM